MARLMRLIEVLVALGIMFAAGFIYGYLKGLSLA